MTYDFEPITAKARTSTAVLALVIGSIACCGCRTCGPCPPCVPAVVAGGCRNGLVAELARVQTEVGGVDISAPESRPPTEFRLNSCEFTYEPVPAAGPYHHRALFDVECRDWGERLWTDHRNFYSRSSTDALLLTIAGAGLLANTSLDQDFRDTYREDIRATGTDDFASVWEPLGRGEILIPACALVALAGRLDRCGPVLGPVDEFGDRATRAYLVGGPPLLLMQYGLGASRPNESRYASRWRPFDDDHAASGHAFIGAVPFLTAARMTDDPVLRAGLFFCSTLPAWSRINDDRHYLSQAILGWCVAQLACRAVDATEQDTGPFQLVPVSTPRMCGVGILHEW